MLLLGARPLVHFLAVLCAIARGDVLEQFLDQVDVREDHASAAVSAKTKLVDGVTKRRYLSILYKRWLVQGLSGGVAGAGDCENSE